MSARLITIALEWQPFAPLLSIWSGAAMLGGAAIFAGVQTWALRPVASAIILAMRLLTITALTVLLMGPSKLLPAGKAPMRAKLTIMLDTSESMLTCDCGGQSRMRAAQEQWLSRQQLAALSEFYDLNLVGFDDNAHPLPLAALAKPETELATGQSTHLAEAVSDTVMKMPGQAGGSTCLILSDGHDTTDASIQAAAELARGHGVTIDAVCLGGQTQQRHIALTAMPMQESMMAGEPGEIALRIYQVGYDQGKTILHLRGGTEKQDIPIQFQGRGTVDLKLPIKEDQPGEYAYDVHVDALEGDADTGNQQQMVFCQVTKKRIRVLMVEGRPYWDSKFLAQALRKDERVELTQVTQISAAKRETIYSGGQDRQTNVPEAGKNWADFDVVILGGDIENVLDGQGAAQLPGFVARGGQLIMARGQPYDPGTAEGQEVGDALALIEPVIWGPGTHIGQSLALTASGRSNAWLNGNGTGGSSEDLWDQLPGFTTMTEVESEKPATMVLARVREGGAGGETAGMPAIVSMPYGRGTVVAILGEGLWQWRLGTAGQPGQPREGEFYDRFWSRLVHWMALGGDFQPGQEVALRLSGTSEQLGNAITMDVLYRDQPEAAAAPRPRLTVIDPSGQAHALALDSHRTASHSEAGNDWHFSASYQPEGTGVYHVRLWPNKDGGLSDSERLDRSFSIYQFDLERMDTSAQPMALRMLAEGSGGKLFNMLDAQGFVRQMVRAQTAMLMPPRREYVWDSGTILTLVLGWLGIEWIARRKAGLL